MRPTATLLIYLATAAAGALAAFPSFAQDDIYRCGNEYTNRPPKGAGCKRVEGGNVTVVRGTLPPSVNPNRVVTAPQASSPEQRARDADAKAILEQELRRAEARQRELLAEYQDGNPNRMPLETKNYQRYLDRVAGMKADIDRNAADIEGLKRELERFNR
ncbi:MAG: hypothetical protein LBP52_00565 [Burkholderiaceae bacterium]|nr:hypothetical protein [Burkholderiaceae bacterium]